MSYRIAGDLHTHTLFTRHAYSTIAENVAAARAAGLEVLGSADHFSPMLFDEPTIKNFQFFINQRIWPREWDGVTLLRGAEVDIVDLDGTLFGENISCPETILDTPYGEDLPLIDRVTASLDYLVASVHATSFADGATIAQGTDMYLAALENPKVFILGHTGRAGIRYDVDTVLKRAAELGKLVEINEHSLAVDAQDGRYHAACSHIAERAAEMGCGITVSSDAHMADRIGKFSRAEEMLAKINFPEELIMNRSRASLLAALERAVGARVA